MCGGVTIGDGAIIVERHVSSERVFSKVEMYRELLSQYPALGAVYGPDYPAAQPPITCRQLPIPETPFTLYYAIDEDKGQVDAFYIGFKGGDPARRFAYSGLY